MPPRRGAAAAAAAAKPSVTATPDASDAATPSGAAAAADTAATTAVGDAGGASSPASAATAAADGRMATGGGAPQAMNTPVATTEATPDRAGASGSGACDQVNDSADDSSPQVPIYGPQADEILARAVAIRARRAAKTPSTWQPPARVKPTGWDFLLKEVAWMAKEFQDERKDKVKKLATYAQRAAKSKLDPLSREEVRCFGVCFMASALV